jgi:hydroxyethylthiazole kinase
VPDERAAAPPIDDDAVRGALTAVAASSPLVHHITNDVTTSETANVTLHWGGLPVMADAPAEAGDMAAGADALVLNTGTATTTDVDTMVEAGHRANEADVPIVLDPVGYGATPHRVESVGRLLKAVSVDIIKGNTGEIRGLAGEKAAVKGVESVGEASGVAEAATALASSSSAVVVASGATDVVAGPDGAYTVDAGHEQMSSFVGSGCMLGSTLATVASAVGTATEAPGSTLEAALVAVLAYGLAGERAADETAGGPASYRTAFMDAVAAITDQPPTVSVDARVSTR